MIRLCGSDLNSLRGKNPVVTFPPIPGHEAAATIVDGSLLEVLAAIRGQGPCGTAFMAEEFKSASESGTQQQFLTGLEGVPVTFEPHLSFKKRVPTAIGLIRTGDTTPYANMILESA
jgi:D-ribose pyranase